MFDKAEELRIEFVKLKNGKHDFNFRVNESFFEELGSTEVKNADVVVQVLVDKNVNWMNIQLVISGKLTVECHRCLVDLPLAIETKYLLIVKLDSHETADTEHESEGIELIYLRPHDFELQIAQPVYESSLLSLPMLRNCDELEHKPCDQAMIQKLNEFNDVDSSFEVDARWEKLKQLKNQK